MHPSRPVPANAPTSTLYTTHTRLPHSRVRPCNAGSLCLHGVRRCLRPSSTCPHRLSAQSTPVGLISLLLYRSYRNFGVLNQRQECSCQIAHLRGTVRCQPCGRDSSDTPSPGQRPGQRRTLHAGVCAHALPPTPAACGRQGQPTCVRARRGVGAARRLRPPRRQRARAVAESARPTQQHHRPGALGTRALR